MRLAAPHPADWDCAITHETDRQRTDIDLSLTDVRVSLTSTLRWCVRLSVMPGERQGCCGDRTGRRRGHVF
ncbi:unnamed protein product [Pleuronectes platessa]|uniref:Uncharacterized protein n=1 Tax=Pleuronectes platessa TaxID=8262 RepID=A0A9N7VTS8_PLEPL|nr:unnamed protein product [Pleuronectes platessa]